MYDTIVRAMYKRICCCLEFYKRSYSILLLLSTDFYNLAPRGVKYLILYEIVLVLYRVSQKKGNHLIFRDILFVFKHKRF